MIIPPRNNLDFIRTLLALGVFSFHAGQFTGMEYPQLPWVPAFIAISGYLITDSMFRSDGYLHFAWKRVLRIGPAFALSFVLVFATGGSLWGGLIDWVCVSLCSRFVNPPLWSLSLEEITYALLACCFAFGMYRSPRTALLWLLLIYASIVVITDYLPFEATPMVSVILSFISGSALYLVRDRVIWSPILALVCLAAVMWMRNTPFAGNQAYSLCIGPPMAYALLTLGLRVRPIFARYKQLIGDPSLGIYVYHFPILIWLYEQRGLKDAELYFTALGLTLCTALLSWHLVEKRALRLRNAMLTSWILKIDGERHGAPAKAGIRHIAHGTVAPDIEVCTIGDDDGNHRADTAR